MTKSEFRLLLEQALEEAARNTSKRLGYEVPRQFIILLHGAGDSGDPMDTETAVDQLYLSEDRFYLIIDVAIIHVHSHHSIVFVRASSHDPGPFAQTWNNPLGNGPFKQLIVNEIKIVKD